MISIDVVLREPEFLPEAKNVGDAGGDLRAYIKQDAYPNTNLKLVNQVVLGALQTEDSFPQTKIYIDGSYVEDWREARSSIFDREYVVLAPNTQFIFDVGLKVALRTNDESKVATMLVVTRSGLACKYLVGVANSPGVIDQGYRNWVGVCLHNQSEDIHIFTHGARIAQALFVEVENQKREGFWNVVSSLDQGERGLGGFGSTGV